MNFDLLIVTALCNIAQAQNTSCSLPSLTRLVCLHLAKKLISFAENVMLFYVLSLSDSILYCHRTIYSIKPSNSVCNRYLYVAVAGAVEAVSYILPIPMMRWTGRRTTSVLLYVISGAALLSILAIPEGELRQKKY